MRKENNNLFNNSSPRVTFPPELNQRCLRLAFAHFLLNVNNNENVNKILGKAQTCVLILSVMAEYMIWKRRIAK